jgi:hypothetical protein
MIGNPPGMDAQFFESAAVHRAAVELNKQHCGTERCMTAMPLRPILIGNSSRLQLARIGRKNVAERRVPFGHQS